MFIKKTLNFFFTSKLNSNSDSNVITLTGDDLFDFFRRNGVIFI